MDELYLVTCVEQGEEEFVGVFSSFRKAKNHVWITEFDNHPEYDKKGDETIELGVKHIWFFDSTKNNKIKHYYISKLKVDTPYNQ